LASGIIGFLSPPLTKRDAPQPAQQLWTHGMPAGPKRRFAPFILNYWAIWNFSKNKSTAKSLLVHLSQPTAIERLVSASGGYEVPSFKNMKALKTWPRRGRQGHALTLPQSLQSPGAIHCGRTFAGKDRSSKSMRKA
jgi:hypothetical protein